jgi:hypothetical protein
MAGEDLKIVTDQDRVGEAKGLNALGDLLYLRAGMTTRIFGVRTQRGA